MYRLLDKINMPPVARMENNKSILSNVEIFDPADTLIASLNSGQITAVKDALAAQDVFFIQGLPKVDKTTVMAELCYQNAKRGHKTLIISQFNQTVDHVLDSVAKHSKITVLRKGTAGMEDKLLPFTEEHVVGTWLSQITYLCQQELLNVSKDQKQAEKMRLELDRLVKRQAEIKEEYTVAEDNITRYNEQRQELTQIEDELQRDCRTLKDQQQALKIEHAQVLSKQQTDSPQMTEFDEKVDKLIAATRETETVITQNLAKREEVIAQLALLSDQATLAKQSERLQEAVTDQVSELKRLDEEKEKIVKCLSLLTAQKPEAYVLLNSNREDRIIAVAEYKQYLIEFAAAAQKIYRQENALENTFLNQDMSLLLDRITTITQRQVDLISVEEDIINELHEISQVLIDTAREYGWGTSLLRTEPQDVVVNCQSISYLRDRTNELLWASPPIIVAKFGFCPQWKKTLLDLIIKAKAMEQIAHSPGTLFEQTTAEIENVLLECRYLTQRIYEACYKHLLQCGRSLDQSYNQTQERLADLTRQLQNVSKESQSITAQMIPNVLADEVSLKQRLEKIEYTLQHAHIKLQGQESELDELQRLVQEKGIEITPNRAKNRDISKKITLQIDEIEQQVETNVSLLAESRQRIVELKDLIDQSCGLMEELIHEEKVIPQKITSISKKLKDVESGFNEIRISLATEWISRINEVTDVEMSCLNQIYMEQANVIGATFVESDCHAFTQPHPECDVVITDMVNGKYPAEILSTIIGGRKAILVG
ncbi:MAG: helicase [Sporomusa sp.]|nr:helicase [Sporomusa sp.]